MNQKSLNVDFEDRSRMIRAVPCPLEDPRRTGARARVAISSDDALVNAGVAAILGSAAGYVVVPADAGSLDVLVVDVTASKLLEKLHKLALRHRGVRFVVLTDAPCDVDLFTAVDYGMAAVVPRDRIDVGRLREALAAVVRGGAYLASEQQERLHEQIRYVQREVLQPRGLTAHGLDSREVDVLRLLARGLALREIGEQLSYSERTIKNILHDMMTRLRFRNRVHAVAYAIRAGLI
ncbi:response regulator transcription factor [Actinacidiphila guanduensis]|uniref:Transcriptional regulator, LuxR family n=1 Tax=Actinacidiphila guanduensis TaxID=310781 RepID=A0A1H0SFG1_9ACTN|nr:response regulator transcription factor [Actinacidiphila guanduensis]SDP39906.1 transcriptional regulator, LuxR family [Actinacidiphila guanduensis]